MLNPLGALSLSTGILSAAVAKGGGATGASFCAASDFGRSANADWVVGAGSGAGAAVGGFVGGELAPCWAIRGQDVAATIVTRAPATSRRRRSAHEWVMSSFLNDDVASHSGGRNPPRGATLRHCRTVQGPNAIEFNGPSLT